MTIGQNSGFLPALTKVVKDTRQITQRVSTLPLFSLGTERLVGLSTRTDKLAFEVSVVYKPVYSFLH